MCSENISREARKIMKGWLKTVFITGALLAAALCGPSAQAAFWQLHPTGPQHVVIDKSQQMLFAYEGNHLVMESRISTGKQGKETPNGRFKAQSKQLMHRSKLYGNVPMPYSVQIAGNYFIHGFKSVPNHPASHGCIRMPVDSAEQFYHWVQLGTPVDIVGAWGR